MVFFFVQAYKLSAYAHKENTLGRNHSATLSTTSVLYLLLVVEGQAAHPRASGVRKHVWVWSADAGVCHPLKAAGEITKDIVYQ